MILPSLYAWYRHSSQCLFEHICLFNMTSYSPTFIAPMARVWADLPPPSPEASFPTPDSRPYALILVARSPAWLQHIASTISSVVQVAVPALSGLQSCYVRSSPTFVSARRILHPQPRLC